MPISTSLRDSEPCFVEESADIFHSFGDPRAVNPHLVRREQFAATRDKLVDDRGLFGGALLVGDVEDAAHDAFLGSCCWFASNAV
jgi:hypothetical protein